MANFEKPAQPSRREFLKKTAAAVGGVAFSNVVSGDNNPNETDKEVLNWVDDNLKERFQEQKKWTLEYIASPKYRERIKRSLARGFFQENEKNFTKTEIKKLRKTKLERLYPTTIDVSQISEKLVDEIIEKRLENVKGAEMGIVNTIDESNLGMYFPPTSSTEHVLGSPGYCVGVSDALREGNNILLSRMELLFSSTNTTVPAHELSHASTMAEKDLEPQLKEIVKKLFNTDKSKINKYYKLTEIKARLDALRFELEKLGIYDSKTEDFNKSHLEIILNQNMLGKSQALNELLRRIDRDCGDDLIWYMNNVADIGNPGYIKNDELKIFLGREVSKEEVIV